MAEADTVGPVQREEAEKQGGMAGEAIGSYYGGPIGGMVGKWLSEKIGEMAGSYIGDKTEDAVEDKKEEKENEEKKKRGGGCSSGPGGQSDYKASDGQCHASPETPKFKLEIEENDVPENWWDKLPDFDPRVYDAISMEQAAACVKYIFDGLPDMHELENKMEARKFRKICPRLKTQVPRTKIVRP